MTENLILSLLIVANLSLFFFLYWKPLQRRKEQEEGLFFESSRGPVFYQVHGKKKKVILLLHGLGASSYCWRKLIPLIEKKFTVINCDLWGFGKSSKDNPKNIGLDEHAQILFELMDHLEIKKFHIAGNSMGALIGFWMAHLKRKRIRKIVALAPATAPNLVPLFIRTSKWVSNFTPWVINHNIVRSMIINVLGNPHNIDKEMVDAYLEPYLNPKAHASFASALDVISDTRVYHSLEKIDHSVLILWGERDKVITRTVINDVIKKLPFAHLEIHQKSGHCPMEEHPEWCADQIIPFLKS